jgi:CDK inhibitor PHO81
LQKEAQLKLRLEKLLAQRRAAATRVLPDKNEENIENHVEWSAVEEGFRQLGNDLAKLQVRAFLYFPNLWEGLMLNAP